MEASYSCYTLSLIFFIFSFPHSSISQQTYVGNKTSCSINDTSTPKRYVCTNSTSSCDSYLAFRFEPLFYNLHFSNITLAKNNLFIVSAPCSCSSHSYQYMTYYTIKSGDSYEKIANVIFQGQTTCSTLRSQNHDYVIDNTSSILGKSLDVPLRCACPAKAQEANGVVSLLVYMLQLNETIGSVARDFGVEKESILEANKLSNSSRIYPFTPILVPLGINETCRINNNCYSSLDDDRESIYPYILLAIGAVVILCRGRQVLMKKLKRRLCKRKYFKQNGGLLLKQKLLEDSERVKVFTEEELEQATDNFNPSRFLGQGAYGTVYKGMLQDNTVVAIKRSKQMETNWIEQFINEVIILSQINHRNIVKLLGCCLETEFPLLVYEFISNGTLSHHIHKKATRESYSLPWKTRLKIASEVAGALSYMHSTASIPIYHRDIKSLNILLDDHYSAKVSDFGTSRFVSCDQSHLTTKVLGTIGYIDPEYFRSSQYTEKSDVYSFGVLMVELLTGKLPVTFAKTDDRNLLDYFISLEKANQLVEILDIIVAKEEMMDVVNNVATLATKCLRPHGKDRPTMKQVYLELEGLINSHDCSKSIEDVESVETSSSFSLEVGSDELTFDSAIISIETSTT